MGSHSLRVRDRCALASVAIAAGLLLPLGAAAQPVVNVTFDTSTPLRSDLTDEYVSVNIDSSSIAKGFDFSDPVLNNLVKQVAPVLMRIGGTASNGIVWTGAPGLPCGCCGRGNGVLLSTDCFDSIVRFLNCTGARLLFDFAPTRDSAGAWDASNATALMQYAASHGAAGVMGAWQLGNEDPGITNGTQMGLDFLTARSIAQSLGLPSAIIGPSAGGTPELWLQQYWNATYGVLDMFSVHQYGGVDCSDVTGASFVSRHTYASFKDGLDGLVQSKAAYMAPSTRLLVEESASAPIGGCVNASNRFIDGFYWLTVMGMPAERGVDQINRQDVAGWSFLGLESSYTLAGPPGWTNGSAALTPHPDWYTTVLWKQLMGNVVLNFTWAGDAAASSNTTIHAWCTASKAGMPAGSVTVAFVVGWGTDVMLQVPSLPTLSPRLEFILTSTANVIPARDAPLPASLFNDVIYLNGAPMVVDSDGLLPTFPIPGRVVNSPTAPILPAYSYGFVVFPSAGVPACGA